MSVLTLYFHPSPNPLKAALMLEELGLDYEPVPVDTFRGEQHDPAFLSRNPNAKVPVLVDGDVTVFDSNAILLHLATRENRLLPSDPVARGDVLSWFFLVATGLSPMSGQAVHFMHMCPEDLPYAKNRYGREVARHYALLDAEFGRHEYLGSNELSISDVAAWGWVSFGDMVLDGGVAAWPNVARWFAAMSARPAAERATALRNRFSMKQEFDEETQRALLPQNFDGAAA